MSTMPEIDNKLLEHVNKYFPLVEFGFGNPSLASNGYIFDSPFCRVKFELSLLNHYPLQETIIYYGRLHAPDNEKSIILNGEKCLCWHSNTHIIVPFIEGVSAQELADDNHGEIWLSLLNTFKVDCPRTDYFEFPLRLHAKLWEHYGERLFSVFDLRKPGIWEEYSRFSTEYNEMINKRLNLSREAEMIC